MEQALNELKNSKDVLIDKICISGLQLISIADVTSLVEEGTITIKENRKRYIPVYDTATNSMAEISSLEIGATPFFDQFKLSISPDGYSYCQMELSIPDDGYHNLNCHTVWECRLQVADALQYLSDEYGIKVQVEQSEGIKLRSVEINRTIPLDHPFKEYQRDLELLMHLLPGTLRLSLQEYSGKAQHPDRAIDNSRQVSTYEGRSGKSGISVKIYNKSEQLNSLRGEKRLEHPVVGEYLRFEVTLLDAKKIKDTFGTNRLEALTDQMVQDYFHAFIVKNVATPYESYTEKRHKGIRKILRKNYVPGSRTWIRDTVLQLMDAEIQNHLPLLLDINEVIDLLKNGAVPFKGNYARQKKYLAIQHFLDVCNVSAPSLTHNDSAKYKELLTKLGPDGSTV